MPTKIELTLEQSQQGVSYDILNGNSKKSLRRDSKGGIIILPPVSFEEHVAIQRETKARTLLLQSLPEDHMADFHHMDDAREIWLAMKARFGGNEESKKMRKTMLKQEFSEFRVSEEEGLHKGYDRGGLEYLSFDEPYNKLRSLEIDVKGGSSYGSRSTSVAPTHSAFIGAASTNTKMVYFDQPSHSSSITYTSAHSGSIIEDVLHSFVAKNKPTQQLAYKDFEQVDEKARYSAFKILEVKTEEPKAMAKIKKKEWEVKFVESLARFDKWKESSKNLAKLKYNSMSTRTKLGIGFKEYIGSDEVCDLSTPSVFNPEPENREVKSLYERFVKAGRMHEVPPPITGTFMPTSYKSDLEETQATFSSKSNTSSINTYDSNDFVFCDNSDKSPASETYDFASCVSSPKTNDSFSTIDVKILLKPASIHAGRHIPAGRFNKPSPFPNCRSVPTGWTNHAARPFFRSTNLYFDNVSWLGIYEHMSMNEGRWGFVVKSLAARVEDDMLCRRQDDMGYNRLKFCMR
nr:xylulose kinase-1 [Tanacetum cinerariifolium]